MDKHESPATAAEGGPYQGAGGVDDDGSSDDLDSCWPREQLLDQYQTSHQYQTISLDDQWRTASRPSLVLVFRSRYKNAMRSCIALVKPQSLLLPQRLSTRFALANRVAQ